MTINMTDWRLPVIAILLLTGVILAGCTTTKNYNITLNQISTEGQDGRAVDRQAIMVSADKAAEASEQALKEPTAFFSTDGTFWDWLYRAGGVMGLVLMGLAVAAL